MIKDIKGLATWVKKLNFNFSNIFAKDVKVIDEGGIIAAVNVEDALVENRTAVDLNTTHRTSNGTDHTYIDQDVTTEGNPEFNSAKIATDSLLVSPVAGTLEFYNDRMYLTNVGTQRAIDRTAGAVTSTTTVANTAVETAIFTGTLGANSLKVGNIIKVHCDGVVSNATTADDLLINIYIGSNLITTLDPAILLVTDAHWHLDGAMTIRTVGESGTMAYHIDLGLDTVDTEEIGLSSIDTTTANDFMIKVTWDNAKAGNIFSLYQGYVEYKN
jgi:hypothetical protein